MSANCQEITGVVVRCHANVTFCDIPCDTVSILGIINAMRGLGQECRFERMVTGKMTEKMTEKKAEKGIKTWTERWRMVYGEKNNTMYSRYQPNERTWRLFFERR